MTVKNYWQKNLGAEPDKHWHKKVKKEKHILSVKAGQLSLHKKRNSLVESADKLEYLHNWKYMKEKQWNKCLQWQLGLGEFQKSSFEKLYNESSGKLPVNIFDMLFSHSHRVLATVKNSAANAVFPIWTIVELPNLCFPNLNRVPKCKNSNIKV